MSPPGIAMMIDDEDENLADDSASALENSGDAEGGEEEGGDLSAENREGGGACFSLWLPWSSPQAFEAEAEAPAALAGARARTSAETAPSHVA